MKPHAHLMGALIALALILGGHSHVLAKDGGSGSGNSGSGYSGSGNSGSGGSGGHDDDGDDDQDRDDDKDNDDDKGGADIKDLDEIRDAVSGGDAVPLSRLLNHLKKHYPGTILNIDLQKRSNVFVYRVKILTPKGRIKSVRLNARTLELVS